MRTKCPREKIMLLSIFHRIPENNKAAGLDLIAAKLLKSDLPSLMNALPESWTEFVLCQELSRHLPTECSV
jgi:hypothetical protein